MLRTWLIISTGAVSFGPNLKCLIRCHTTFVANAATWDLQLNRCYLILMNCDIRCHVVGISCTSYEINFSVEFLIWVWLTSLQNIWWSQNTSKLWTGNFIRQETWWRLSTLAYIGEAIVKVVAILCFLLDCKGQCERNGWTDGWRRRREVMGSLKSQINQDRQGRTGP
jgi:hypothetical protein